MEVCEKDGYRDEGINFYRLCAKAGVQATCNMILGIDHCDQIDAGALLESVLSNSVWSGVNLLYGNNPAPARVYTDIERAQMGRHAYCDVTSDEMQALLKERQLRVQSELEQSAKVARRSRRIRGTKAAAAAPVINKGKGDKALQQAIAASMLTAGGTAGGGERLAAGRAAAAPAGRENGG